MVLEQRPAQARQPPPRNKVDWAKFAEEVDKITSLRTAQTPGEVDSLAKEFTEGVRAALEVAQRPPANTGRRLPPLPHHVAKLLAEKRRVRKRWQQCRDPTVKTRLNRLSEEIKSEMQTHQTIEWERRLDEATDDWNSIHRLCRQLSNTPAPVRPLLHRDGTPRYRAEDRAEIFAEALEEQFRPNADLLPEHTAEIEEFLRNRERQQEEPNNPPIFFSPGQVRKAILRSKPRKAPGADNISNAVLRHLPLKAVAAVARLFTGILRCGHFPREWKLGHVVMIPKAGKNILKPDSYRPITLLPSISKVFERLLLQHLVPHITPRPEQFGFRAEHSTTLQLTRVLHHLALTANRREQAVAVFLDMQKAFDRVWYAGLVYKLAMSSTPNIIVRIIESFLEGRRFRVLVEGQLSSEHQVAAGVPQGSCLSPSCYSLYTNDIPAESGVMLALYADDAAYITTSMSLKHAAKKMQRALDLLPEWLQKWRLTVNVAKTQAICATSKKIFPPALELQGQKISWSGTAKYLGVTIDRRLRMGQHCDNVVNSARVARNLLKPVLNSALPLKVKVSIYKTYIRPRITYAATAWFGLLSATNKNRLRAQQRLALRTITAAPRYVRNATVERDLRIEDLDGFIHRLSRNMFARTEESGYPHLRELAPRTERDPKGRPYPRELAAIEDPTDDHPPQSGHRTQADHRGSPPGDSSAEPE